jgi:putative ABC transport system permease protein
MLFRRRNRDLDREISSHLAEAERERLADGETQDAARLAARREFGSEAFYKEATRENWMGAGVERLLKDLQYALRQLRSHPGFAASAVLTLALGIGANSAIFSVVNAVLLHPLPYPEAERLMWGTGRTPKGSTTAAVSPPDFRDYREKNRTFQNLSAFFVAGVSAQSWSGNGQARQLHGAMVTSGFFETLGYSPILGRSFTRADEETSAPQSVVLSYHMWQQMFGGNPAAAGLTARVDGNPVTIVGVMPQALDFPRNADFWFAAPLRAQGLQRRMGHMLFALGRLRPGVTEIQAQNDLDTIAAELGRQFPATNKGWGVHLQPMQEYLVGPTRPVLLMLLAAVGLVLLIACVNIANLLLARYGSRRREIAIRTAIGGGRLRILAQFLTENLLLALLAGGVALLLARWGIAALRGFGPESLPRLQEVRLDGAVLAFTAAVSLSTSLLFGLGPAWLALRSASATGLREDSRAGAGRQRRALGGALVVAETGLSICLLIGAALLVESLYRTLHTAPGFRTANVLSAEMMLPKSGNDLRRQRLVDGVIAEVRALPGVEAAGGISEMPIHNEFNDTFFDIVEHPASDPNNRHDEDFRRVTSGYFAAMRIPLLRGRLPDDRDTASAPPVVVIDEPFARRYFAGEDPIGKHIRFGDAAEIVGIVGGVRNHALRSAPRPSMYLPFAQEQSDNLHLVVRATADPAALSDAIRRIIAAQDPDVALSGFESMDQFIAQSVAGDRFDALLVGLFAALALILAMAGVYGVFSYIVAQQTHEIGVRMALGAHPRQMLGEILLRGGRLAAAGAILGAGGAWFVTRALKAQLYGVTPHDPVAFGGAVVVLIAVALIACAIPARRAMRVDPLLALRYE